MNKTRWYEVRIKNNGNLFSRHYRVKTKEQAAERALGLGNILFVRKVQTGDVRGLIKSMNLEDVINVKPPERRQDVILDEVTLDSIILPPRSPKKQTRQKRQSAHKPGANLKG